MSTNASKPEQMTAEDPDTKYAMDYFLSHTDKDNFAVDCGRILAGEITRLKSALDSAIRADRDLAGRLLDMVAERNALKKLLADCPTWCIENYLGHGVRPWLDERAKAIRGGP